MSERSPTIFLIGDRELADHGGHGQDLVIGGQPRVFQQVHHLDLVAAGHMLLTGAAQVLDGPDAVGRLAGHVQAQIPGLCGIVLDPGSAIRGGRLAHRCPPLPGRASAQRRVAMVYPVRLGVGGLTAFAPVDPVDFRPLGGELVLHRDEVGLALR